MNYSECKKDFEQEFDIPDFLSFDGEDYVYYEEDPVLMEQSQSIQDQWRGFKSAYIIKEKEISTLKKDLETGIKIVNKQIKQINKLLGELE